MDESDPLNLISYLLNASLIIAHNPNKSSVSPHLLLIGLSLGLLACNPPLEPEEGRAPETTEEHNEMLSRLGFDVELGARVDEQGQALTTSWHPLGAKHASFFPALEVYMAGPNFGTGMALMSF